MIGTIDIAVNAASPQLPLTALTAHVSSPSQVRLLNVPRAIGLWQITTVAVEVSYPDGAIVSVPATRLGGVWSATLPAPLTPGIAKNGFRVVAGGVDEKGEAVAGYILGVGDVAILDADGTLVVGTRRVAVRIVATKPEAPREGDLVLDSMEIFDGESWVAMAGVRSYQALTNKPKINGVELNGEMTAADLDLAAISDLPPAPIDPETATYEDIGKSADARKTKDFVEYLVSTNTARFQGEFAQPEDIPAAAPEYLQVPPTNNDYIVVRDMRSKDSSGNIFTAEGAQIGSINANGEVDSHSTGFRYTAPIAVTDKDGFHVDLAASNVSGTANFRLHAYDADGEWIAQVCYQQSSSGTVEVAGIVPRGTKSLRVSYLNGSTVSLVVHPYEGAWRWIFSGDWDDVGKDGWSPAFMISQEPLTPSQMEALNSGITESLVRSIGIQLHHYYDETGGSYISWNGVKIESYAALLALVQTGRVVLVGSTSAGGVGYGYVIFRPHLASPTVIYFDATGTIEIGGKNGVYTRRIAANKTGTDNIVIAETILTEMLPAVNPVVGPGVNASGQVTAAVLTVISDESDSKVLVGPGGTVQIFVDGASNVKKIKVGNIEIVSAGDIAGAPKHEITIDGKRVALEDAIPTEDEIITLAEAACKYKLVTVGADGNLTDRAINATSAASVTVPDDYTDLLIRATVTGSLAVTMPDGVTVYGDDFPAESGEYLVTITKIKDDEAFVKTLTMEVPNA